VTFNRGGSNWQKVERKKKRGKKKLGVASVESGAGRREGSRVSDYVTQLFLGKKGKGVNIRSREGRNGGSTGPLAYEKNIHRRRAKGND